MSSRAAINLSALDQSNSGFGLNAITSGGIAATRSVPDVKAVRSIGAAEVSLDMDGLIRDHSPSAKEQSFASGLGRQSRIASASDKISSLFVGTDGLDASRDGAPVASLQELLASLATVEGMRVLLREMIASGIISKKAQFSERLASRTIAMLLQEAKADLLKAAAHETKKATLRTAICSIIFGVVSMGMGAVQIQMSRKPITGEVAESKPVKTDGLPTSTGPANKPVDAAASTPTAQKRALDEPDVQPTRKKTALDDADAATSRPAQREGAEDNVAVVQRSGDVPDTAGKGAGETLDPATVKGKQDARQGMIGGFYAIGNATNSFGQGVGQAAAMNPTFVAKMAEAEASIKDARTEEVRGEGDMSKEKDQSFMECLMKLAEACKQMREAEVGRQQAITRG